LFYPVFVSLDRSRVVAIGESKPVAASRDEWEQPPGTIAIWPLNTDGTEGRWRTSPAYLRELAESGYVRPGQRESSQGRGTIWYLGRDVVSKIKTGEVEVIGRDDSGVVRVRPVSGASSRTTTPKTVWNRASHHAGWHGSALVRALIPGRDFPFPKSLYSVEDALRIAVKGNPRALVLDFFAGSGTTAHAVMRLNRQDGGRRQSIMVTNNEVSAEEAAQLRKRGLRPGDAEWEALGIFEHITRPRVTAAVTGRTPDGEPIKGDYKFTDEFPMADGFEENVSFLELRYLDADEVDLGLAFDDLAPLLWLRAGAQGPIARRLNDAGLPRPYVWTNRYGVLFEEDRWRAFVADRPESAQAAFIITYSPTTFAGIAAELPAAMDTVRLPDTYLSMFRPDRGRA
jgi:adenine-specific DNA-methyltransferase